MKPNIIDLRGQLPRSGAFPQRALSQITIIAVHYQGADTDPNEAILDLLVQDANFHINKNWCDVGVCHGYGIEYHYAVDGDGIYQIEEETNITWNDTNANVITLAVVLPRCGPNTPPDAATLANLKLLLDWLTTERPDFPAAQGDVYGHGELIAYGNSTACPGSETLHWVQQYRTGTVPYTPPPQPSKDDQIVTLASVIGEETYKPKPNLVQIQMWVQEIKRLEGAY